jgi:ElaB/YqjD/DUF883 family membrane-anchored ribosome-binding protein
VIKPQVFPENSVVAVFSEKQAPSRYLQFHPGSTIYEKPDLQIKTKSGERTLNTMNGDSKAQAETALRDTADNVASLASRVEETVKRTQARLSELQSAVVDKTKNAAQTTDTYVHDNPWTAVATAAGIGFVLGLIIGRK